MIFKILLATVVLTPLPFASVYPWNVSLLAILVGMLLIAWLVERIVKHKSTALGFRSIWPLVILFFLTVFWAGIQSSNVIPDSLIAPLWRQAMGVMGVPLAGSISINPEITMSFLMRLMTYAGVFWLSFQYCRKTENASLAIKTIILTGFFYAAYGLWVSYSGSRTILWFDKFAYFDDLTSTFVNRNSYATYAGLGLICTTGLFIKIVMEPLAKPFGRTERIRQLIDEVLEYSWFYLVIWVAIMMAILLSHSRAGFLCTVLALIVLSLLLTITKGVRIKYAVYVSSLSLIMTGVLLYFGGDVLDKRFGVLVSGGNQRFEVYQIIVDSIWGAPWVGTGYGTFAEAFQSLRTPDISLTYLKAHNSYLENMLELGVIAAVPQFGILMGFLYLTFRGVRSRRRNNLYPAIGFSSTLLVGMHSLVDFSLQIPAVAITYCLIMGAAVAQSWSMTTPVDKW
jgi:O-antigen ligase